MENLTLEEILKSLPKINEKRSYWFFRTNGGDFYENFIEGKYIAIGHNKVTLAHINQGNTKDASGVEILGNTIDNIYNNKNKKNDEEEKRPWYVASQLLKFTYSIKKGDIVFIPSANSHFITFGEVQETPVYLDKAKDEFDCYFFKRKHVKWLKTLRRDELDPNLYKLMFSHHTITEADSYAEHIDKILNSFFIKNNKAHLVLNVQTHKDIKAKDLFETGSILLDLLDEFAAEEGLDYKSDDFSVKLNLQSPGVILLAGVSMGGILIIGLIIVGLAGGGFTFKYGKELSTGIKSDGIIEKIKSFLTSHSNTKVKKEILEKHMKDLEIKDPDDLVKILKELNKK